MDASIDGSLGFHTQLPQHGELLSQNGTPNRSSVDKDETDKEYESGEEDMDMEGESAIAADDEDLKLQNDIQAQIDSEPQVTAAEAASDIQGVQDNTSIASNKRALGPAAIGSEQRGSPTNSRPPAYYSIYKIPPHLGRIRQTLFELNEPIEISLAEYDKYWPFIDNIWVKQRSNSTRDGLRTTDYYMCRLRRPTCRPHPPRPLPEGKKPRKKVVREGSACNVQIKVVKFEGAYSTVTITRTPGSAPTHSHDLHHLDKVKRNSALIEMARIEVEKGYLPTSIFAKFREEPEKLFAAGGQFLSITDIRNVSAKWRSTNPGVTLRPHEGYSYQQGFGIIRERRDQPLEELPGTPQRTAVDGGTSSTLPADILPFPAYSLEFLEPYLPKRNERRDLPHVTLTYACSMDGKVSLVPGAQTALSGPESKLMTHFLRSRHDAILVGVGTAVADDPGLNCRLEGAGGFGGLGRSWQPRPIIVDPTGRWPAHPECRLMKTTVAGKGKAPWVVVSPGANILPDKLMALKSHGGDFLRIVEYNQSWRLRWEAIFRALGSEGIQSIMIEGGATVISELLNPEYADFIDSVIVTVAPTYLGRGGLGVSPDSKQDETGKPKTALTPKNVSWRPLGQDVVMCSKLRVPPPTPMLPGIEAVAQEQET